MGDESDSRTIRERFAFGPSEIISDPNRRLHTALNLQQGTLLRMFSPRTWVRGFHSAIIKGHGFGKPVGDPWQMPGVFLIHRGQILREFRHRSPADRPDYLALAAGGATGTVAPRKA